MKTKIVLNTLWIGLILVLTTQCNQAQTNQIQREPAPEFPSSLAWLNTDKPIKLADLKGKIVLLDFWTYGCINCQHVIPDLTKLEKEYGSQLVVLGVHSAKFDNEKNTDNIRKAILKFGIEHPVVNDAEFNIWNQYGVEAWPTVVLIDPSQHIVKKESGEGVYGTMKPEIDQLLTQFAGKINQNEIFFKKEQKEKSELQFPTKLIRDEEGNYYIANTGNNRIMKISKEGKILLSIGSGGKGLVDGDFDKAQFNDPQGLAIHGKDLFVADTRNHAIRKIDLDKRQVTTWLGNGQQATSSRGLDLKPGEALNSPWDIAIDGEKMYIAMAGNHQLWLANITNQTATRYAGNGDEALVNGPVMDASFSQPSGLCLKGNRLYVADAEASAIRMVDLQKNEVETVFGKGLFDFGDVDGDVSKALIQHSVAVAVKDNLIYIADTYNGKIKVLNTATHTISTLVGGLEEPNGLLLEGDDLWITNTNKNQIIVVNLKTKEKRLVPITR